MTQGRRSFIRMTAASLAATGALPARAAASEARKPDAKGAAPDSTSATGVTQKLARWVLGVRGGDIPAQVRKEGVRTLLNYLGVAVGGSRHATVDACLAALSPFAGSGQSGIFGRPDRLDPMNAAFVNGVSSHIFDFDDTHLKTIIHPGGPVASALLALSQVRPASGADFLDALVVGMETECRIGNAVYPDHYDRGWHITGTAGPFGAAAAAGRLLKLNEQQMIWALGLAASQPVGFRESFGSMNKSFNPGRAAANGLFAAVLASKGFTSSESMIEAKRGWANTISTKQDYREITEGLGQRWEAALNTYKPFACGVVLHPAIDAALQLRRENRLTPDQIERIDLKVHALVLELTGKKTPQQGLEGKFSVYHTVAVAMVEGAAGEKQYSDRAVRDPAVVALRGKVFPVVDPAIQPAQVDLTVTLKDGRTLTRHIEHALGSVEAPMSDVALQAKFDDLVEGVLPGPQARRLSDLAWGVEKQASAAALVEAGVVKRVTKAG